MKTLLRKTTIIKSYPFLFFLLLTNISFSQNKLYNYPAEVPSTYKINTLDYYKELLNRYNINNEDENKDYFLKKYLLDISTSQKDMLSQGELYIGFTELENYLNDLLSEILPKDTISKYNMHVFPTRTTSVNAYAIGDGSIYFDISLFSLLENESEIAFILAHEASHILKKHGILSYKSYSNLSDGTYTGNILIDILLIKVRASKTSKVNLKIEEEADKTAIDLISYSRFSNKAEIECFKKFEDYHKIYQYHKPSLNGLLLYIETHPENSERIEYSNKYLENLKTRNNVIKGDFNPELMEKYKNIALDQYYESLLFNHSYYTCAQEAFKNYLLNSNDNTSLYYIVESLRRIIYLSPNKSEKPFITDMLQNKYLKGGKSILQNLDIFLNTSDISKNSKDNELFDQKATEFTNITETFNYFSKKAIERNCKEALLSIALYYNNDSQMRNQFLKKYLENKNIQNREFAELLIKSGSNISTKGKKQLIYLSNYSFPKDDLVNNKENIFKATDLIEKTKESLKDFSNIIFCINEINSDIGYKNQLLLNKLYSLVKTKSKNFNIFILEPEYYNLFNNLGINSVCFYNVNKSYLSNSSIIKTDLFAYKITVPCKKIKKIHTYHHYEKAFAKRYVNRSRNVFKRIIK